MDDSNLKAKEELIQLISKLCNEQDILSMSRNLGINSADFYVREAALRKTANDKAAEKFSMLLNSFLDKLSDIDEENFPESELFDPMEFEDKMRNKAKLSEDIIKQGILLKSDIIVLSRKAYAFDYGKYSKLIQKLSKFYLYKVCEKFPRNEFDANKRFAELRKALIHMIPDELYDRDDDTEEYMITMCT